MPNPRGNPESLKPFTTDRDEPLTDTLTIKITKSMADDLKDLGDKKSEFVRQAIDEKLEKKGK